MIKDYTRVINRYIDLYKVLAADKKKGKKSQKKCKLCNY